MGKQVPTMPELAGSGLVSGPPDATRPVTYCPARPMARHESGASATWQHGGGMWARLQSVLTLSAHLRRRAH